MNTYKITNITDTLGKRDVNFNKTLKIDYIDNMIKKTILLKPKDSLFFTTKSLPLSLHKFRMKNLINVSEINDKEFKNIQNNLLKPKKKNLIPSIKSTKTSNLSEKNLKRGTYRKKSNTNGKTSKTEKKSDK